MNSNNNNSSKTIKHLLQNLHTNQNTSAENNTYGASNSPRGICLEWASVACQTESTKHSADGENHLETIIQLKKKVKSQAAEIDRLSKDNEAKATKINQLEVEKSESTKEKETAQNEIRRLKEKNDKAQNEIFNLKEEIKHFKEGLMAFSTNILEETEQLTENRKVIIVLFLNFNLY